MNVAVARRYEFYGAHSVPGLAMPWSAWHAHAYTVEVVAEGPLTDGGIVVDTDRLDEAWIAEGFKLTSSLGSTPFDLNTYADGGENTTVERLAARWLAMFSAAVPEVVEVTVWEDGGRWGRARR